MINPKDKDLFLKHPNDFVLRLDNSNQFSVEKKGIWTWFKAHTFWSNEYDLHRIVGTIEKFAQNFENVFLREVNNKIYNYNTTRVIDKQIPPLQLTNISFVARKTLSSEHAQKEISDEDTFIHRAVLEHLQPYLDGKITRNNENIHRPPLVPYILDKLQNEFPYKSFDVKFVYSAVLKEYIDIAAWSGCFAVSSVFVSQHTERIFPKTSDIVQQIKEPFLHAILIDFRDQELPDNLEARLNIAVNNFKTQYSAVIKSDKTPSSAGRHPTRKIYAS